MALEAAGNEQNILPSHHSREEGKTTQPLSPRTRTRIRKRTIRGASTSLCQGALMDIDQI